MKIVFNLSKIGLGNNGGSRTIIRCAETLAILDVKVIIYGVNKYTWHKPKGIQFIESGKIPNCDVIIASGFKTVNSTINANAKHKLYYIRGFELWQATQQQLLDSYKQLRCIVNSQWLYNFLQSNNIHCELLYQGLDTEWFTDLNRVREGFGAIFHGRHVTKRHVDAISLGRKIKIRPGLLNRDLRNANPDTLNKWYNKLKVWFAPTELEGLHNPPMEAALAGCALVCTDHPRSGMQDYAIHNETAMVYPARDLDIASDYIQELLVDEDKRIRLNKNLVDLLVTKIGTREQNMIKFLEMMS